MLLTIDVGNTNMLFGIYQGNDLLGSFRISTNWERTSDELGMMIAQYYQLLNLDIKETQDAIISSVVPQVMHSINNAIKKFIKIKPIIVGVDIQTGIENKYDNPKEVGMDRLVNAVSAIHKYGSPLIIVDMGTATTFDAIDKDGAYLGGAIFPGIRVAMEALFMKAAKLPRIDILRPDHAIGKTTVQSMQSGAVRGYAGAVEGIVRDMKTEIGSDDVTVIATGGMGRMMSQYCDIIDDVDSNLTLKGLQMIYQASKEN